MKYYTANHYKPKIFNSCGKYTFQHNNGFIYVSNSICGINYIIDITPYGHKSYYVNGNLIGESKKSYDYFGNKKQFKSTKEFRKHLKLLMFL